MSSGCAPPFSTRCRRGDGGLPVRCRPPPGFAWLHDGLGPGTTSPVEEFLVRYGAVAVVLGAMLEGDLSIVMAGVVAHLGYLSLATALEAAWLGAFIGDSLWYALGRVRADAIKRSGVYRRAAPLIGRLVARLGDREIVLARFVYGTRIASMFYWGVHRLPFARFALLDLIGCLLSVLVLGL